MMSETLVQLEELRMVAHRVEEQRRAEREERRLAEQEEERRLAQLDAAWHEVQLAKGVEKGTAGASQLAQEVDVFGEKLENYIGRVNKMGTTMKCLEEHRKRSEMTKEEKKKRRDDRAALIALTNQTLAESEEAQAKSVEALRVFQREAEERRAELEERRLAQAKEFQMLDQLEATWHEIHKKMELSSTN